MILEIALALTLKDLAWLAGGWQVTQGATECTEEQWTAPSSNLLVGMSRTVVGGRTRSFEFMRIEARADGIYYVAQRAAARSSRRSAALRLGVFQHRAHTGLVRYGTAAQEDQCSSSTNFCTTSSACASARAV